ncbi:MAG: hypothetical protein LBV79_02835 [Candidatus Adiutrix sp.]|jgi:hypothetical protein|nr:hypothetical protein [Candidatus Adiutrix sp.]
MKLFDLDNRQQREVRRFFTWHLAYMALIAVFFTVIYYFGIFKSSRLLRERAIFTVLAPLCTLAFVAASPWRDRWLHAVRDTYERLEGEPAFCLMGGLVFYFGFYIYSVLLWGLGALGPSLFYM